MSSPRRTAQLATSLSAVLIATLPGSSHAASYNIGAGGDWTAAATWNPNIAGGPASTDIINAQPSGGAWSVVSLGGDRTVASVGSSGTSSSGITDFVSSVSGVNLLTITGNISKTQSTDASLRFLDGPAGTIKLNVGGTVSVSAGTLVLSGNNTISGGTTVSGAGFLHLKNAGALGTSTLAFAGGTVDNLSGAAMTLSGNNPVSITGNFAFSGTHDLNLGTGAVTLASARTITLTGAAGSTLTLGGVLTNGGNSNNTLTVDGAGNTLKLGGLVTASQSATSRIVTIQGTGNTVITGAITDGTGTAGGLTKDGSGVVTLMAASSHNGITSVNGGVLNIRHADALGTTTGGTNVAVGGTLQLQGDITTAAEALGLRGAGAPGQTGALVNVSGTNNYAGLISFGATGGATVSSDSGTLNLTHTGIITGGNASSIRSITLAGAGNGSVASVLQLGTHGGVIKTGSGGWTLLAVNTYAGETTISGGRLTIAGTAAINGTSGVSIGSGEFNYNSATALARSVSFSGTGGILSGTGTITTAVTITAGNAISPGNATGTGTLALGALDAAGGATFNLSLGTESDLLAVTGAFTGSTAAGGLTFNFDNAGGLLAGHTYTLLTFGSRSGFDYTDLATGSIASTFVLDTSFGTGGYRINGNSLEVQFASSVPEPSFAALALGVGAMAGVFVGRRRRIG